MSGSISATTLATMALATTAVGTGVGVLGSIRAGNAASASANYNAQVASNNAEIAKQNATYTANAGEIQAAQSQQKTKATVGAIIASQAANGIDVGSGSALKVQKSAEKLGLQDALNVRANAARTAYGYQNEAVSQKAQSELDKYTASNDEIAGYVGAGTTVLGGLGNAGSKYADFLNKGG